MTSHGDRLFRLLIKNIIMFRKLLLIIVLAGLWQSALLAQQEEQYTQFMNYRLGLNPAYAGSEGGTNIGTLVRSQWLGIDGAPQTQLVTFDMSLASNKIGVGGNILRHSFGITEMYTLEGAYSYRLEVARGYLRLGLSASVRRINVNYANVVSTQPVGIDEAIPVGSQSKFVPNFGAGLYYYNPKFYVGLSIPRFLQNNIDLSDAQGTISREVLHLYLMGGTTIPISDGVKLQPNVLLKYVENAPFDADFNMMVQFMEKFYAGASYRVGGSRETGFGEAVSLILGADITENLYFGLAYDATLSELRNYNNGSVEGTLFYYFSGKSKEEEPDVEAPRPDFY